MANHFVKASFLLVVTDAEAEVLRRVHEAIEIIGDLGLERAEREAQYRSLGEGFAACFPPTEAEVFGGFLAIFSDPDYPRLGFSLQVDPPDGSGGCQVWLHGDQVDIEAAAALIHAVARTALPFGFEYALDCDRGLENSEAAMSWSVRMRWSLEGRPDCSSVRSHVAPATPPMAWF